jgi:hypothetical protein
LTPDKTGRAEGGHTLDQFIEIIRTGHDLDKIHPTCKSASDPNVAAGICIPPPVDGNLLQVMPWPDFQNMTDHDIQAMYEYLSAIPCINTHQARRRQAPPMSYLTIASDANLLTRMPLASCNLVRRSTVTATAPWIGRNRATHQRGRHLYFARTVTFQPCADKNLRG